MRSIQVTSVPNDTHQTMEQRVSRAGQSLQEYLLQVLCIEARSPTVEEVLQRVGEQTGSTFSLQEAVAAVRAERDSR